MDPPYEGHAKTAWVLLRLHFETLASAKIHLPNHVASNGTDISPFLGWPLQTTFCLMCKAFFKVFHVASPDLLIIRHEAASFAMPNWWQDLNNLMQRRSPFPNKHSPVITRWKFKRVRRRTARCSFVFLDHVGLNPWTAKMDGVYL